MATDDLLKEFPPIDTALWEEAIFRDLKGADYSKKLIWHTPEGLAVKPYYRAEDTAELDLTNAAAPKLSGIRTARNPGNWLIREEVADPDPREASRAAQSRVDSGAEQIAFTGVDVSNASDLELLLAPLHTAPVHFHNAAEPLLQLLITRLTESQNSAFISTGWDPLVNPEFAAEVIRNAPPTLIPFTIDGSEFEEAGATAVNQVGFTLAAGIEFLSEMQARGVPVNRAFSSLEFSFAVGASYFFEIAKLRAFRALWGRVVESFGGTAENVRSRIHARTSRWNKTMYEPHVNILRATTEAMSAILGGADSVTVAAFDECYKVPDETSRRLARNTQIILKQEALLGQVADAGAGCYYLEVITNFIAQAGWKSMQSVETDGGYRKAVADGKLSKTLEESLAAKAKAVTLRQRVLTGTNRFADPSERALNRLDSAFLANNRRAARDYETLRLCTERHAEVTGRTPRVLLAEFGDVKMRAARSSFALDFLACAGFEIVTQTFQGAEEIAALDSDVIVLCSSDSEYPSTANALTLKLKSLGRETLVVVAGNPDFMPELGGAGVSDFIHIKSNPIQVLKNLQEQLGIKG